MSKRVEVERYREPVDSVCYAVRMECECGGEMHHSTKTDPMEWLSGFTHTCDRCGKIEKLDDLYPTVTYREEPR